jgi:hypothetical protein
MTTSSFGIARALMLAAGLALALPGARRISA